MNNLTPKGSGANLTFISTTSTGLAIPLKQVGPIDIFTFGTIGTSVSGTSSSLAGTWGGSRRRANWQDKLAFYSVGSVYRWKMDRRIGYWKKLLMGFIK